MILEFHSLSSHCSFHSNPITTYSITGPCVPNLVCPSVLPSATYLLPSPNLLTIYFNQDPSWLPTALRKMMTLFSFIHNTLCGFSPPIYISNPQCHLNLTHPTTIARRFWGVCQPQYTVPPCLYYFVSTVLFLTHCMCVWSCVSVCVCGMWKPEVKAVFSLVAPPPHFMRQGLSLVLELSDSAWLAGLWVPETNQSLPPHHWHYTYSPQCPV